MEKLRETVVIYGEDLAAAGALRDVYATKFKHARVVDARVFSGENDRESPCDVVVFDNVSPDREAKIRAVYGDAVEYEGGTEPELPIERRGRAPRGRKPAAPVVPPDAFE